MANELKLVAMQGGDGIIEIKDFWGSAVAILTPLEAMSLGQRLISIGNAKAIPGETLVIKKGAK